MQLLKVGSGKGPAKYWDYYNPTAFLADRIIRETIKRINSPKVVKVIGYPRGYRVSSFLFNLGIKVGAPPNEYSEDMGIELSNGKTVVVQVKSLAGVKDGSGPKQSGYEAHRMAGLSFVTMWAYDKQNGEIIEKSVDKIVILDGYWKGPKNYPQKSLNFIHKFAHAKKIFFIDEVHGISSFIKELVS
jgi:hypothetical protein